MARWWPARGALREARSWAPPTALDSPAVLRELERFRLWHLQRLRREGGGEWLGRGRGESNEFREYRPYVPGDDFRLIDWGLYIRLERVYVKTFLDEEHRFIHVLLDRSLSMRTPDRSKFAVARDLALALSHLALVGEDRLLVEALPAAGAARRGSGRPPHALGGPGALPRVRSLLARLRPEGVLRAGEALAAYAARESRRRGLAILISDLLAPAGELAEGLGALVRRRFGVAVLEVRDPRDEAFPQEGSLARAIDEEDGQARLFAVNADNRQRHAEALEAHRQAVDAACARLGVPLARHRTGESAEDFLLRALPSIGLLRPRRRC